MPLKTVSFALNAVAPRLEQRPVALPATPPLAPDHTRLGAFDADIARRLDGRQIPGVRLRNAFVRHPDRGALRVDVGIGQIGLDERAADRFRPRRASADRQARPPRQERRAQKRTTASGRAMRRAASAMRLSPKSSPPHAPFAAS